MTSGIRERLYALLPAFDRLRDAEEGEPLRALFAVIERELHAVEDNIGDMYRNAFIETCDEWVAPYIGDLLGVRGLLGTGDGVFTQRAYVANTLDYRRRKGTAAVLERLARDISGWPARAVEFWQILGATQNLNHVRLLNVRTPDLRDTERLGLIGGPFETAAHAADVRRIAPDGGRYNLPNVGLFLWRLQSYPLEGVDPARSAAPGVDGFHFSPLGSPSPVFNRPQAEESDTALLGEANAEGPIRPAAFHFHRSDYYGPDAAFALYENSISPGSLIDLARIMCKDLSAWAPPPSGMVAVDVRLGRFAFPAGEAPARVVASYAYGFSADIGGGPYRRSDTLAVPAADTWTATVGRQGADFTTVSGALAAWADPNTGNRRDAIITVADNATYDETLSIAPAAGRTLVIQAADGARPVIRLTGDLAITAAELDSVVVLNGLALAGAVRVETGALSLLRVVHCTLVPGLGLNEGGEPARPEAPSLAGDAPNVALRVEIDRSITGALRLPPDALGLTVRDSIVGSAQPDGPGTPVQALVSGNLSPFPELSFPFPALDVSIGSEGPHRATLAFVPASLAAARDALQDAIRAAHPSPAFTNARVLSAGNLLLVAPGGPAPVRFTNAGADPTATELRLAGAARLSGALSGPLPAAPALSAAAPEMAVTIGVGGPVMAALSGPTGSLNQAASSLQAAIRAAGETAAFAKALAFAVDGRLLALAGAPDAPIVFGRTNADAATVQQLALGTGRPAIAGDEAGAVNGPPATLERVTVYGAVYVEALPLASECLFTGAVQARRRQEGCVRFSYVPDGSRTPRRYRCQPDMALARRAAELGLESSEDLPPDERRMVLVDTRPAFTSVHYGQPAYAQLSGAGPEGIRAGAEDGGEMGAFHFLMQPQREANLRAAVSDYLRVGLAAGYFFVT